MNKKFTESDFIDRVEGVRTLQKQYYAIASGQLPGVTAAEKAKILRDCKRSENEIDEWIVLYRARASALESLGDRSL